MCLAITSEAWVAINSIFGRMGNLSSTDGFFILLVYELALIKKIKKRA
jgi:hypothetical protein